MQIPNPTTPNSVNPVSLTPPTPVQPAPPIGQPATGGIAGPISTPPTPQPTTPPMAVPTPAPMSPGGNTGGGLPPIQPSGPVGMPNTKPIAKPAKSKSMLIVVVLFILVLGIGGFLGYNFLFANKEPINDGPTPAIPEETQPATPDDLIPASGYVVDDPEILEVTEMIEDESETMIDSEGDTITEAPVE